MPIHMVVCYTVYICSQSQIKSGMGSGLCSNKIKRGGVDINNLGAGRDWAFYCDSDASICCDD